MPSFKFIWKAIVSGWTFLAILIGVIGNLDTITSHFATNSVSQWIATNWPILQWQTWVIIALLIILISSVMRAYGMYKEQFNKEKELCDHYEGNLLEVKNTFETGLQKIWDASKSIETQNNPLSLEITSKLVEGTLLTQMVEMTKPLYSERIMKWLKKYVAAEDGLLYVKNTGNEPVRVRATGLATDSNYKLKTTPITYVIQWQGLPSEDRTLWPNETATLYVVGFGVYKKNALITDRVFIFPSARREKMVNGERYKVDFIIEDPDVYNIYPIPISDFEPVLREIKLTVSLSSNSLLNPTKYQTYNLLLDIQTDGTQNQLQIISNKMATT